MSSSNGKSPVYSAEEIAAVGHTLRSGKVNYWTGEECRAFEREYAEHCNRKHAIVLANGSVSLDLALEATGIGEGYDVIVTPPSFVASVSCVVRAGARSVFAEVNQDSQNITVASIAAALTPNTKAIIPVHHAGWPCDMPGQIVLRQPRDAHRIGSSAAKLYRWSYFPFRNAVL